MRFYPEPYPLITPPDQFEFTGSHGTDIPWAQTAALTIPLHPDQNLQVEQAVNNFTRDLVNCWHIYPVGSDSA